MLGALGVLWYLFASGRLDNEGTSVSIDMPSVIDLPSAEAIALLQGEDLEVSTTFEEREDVPPDIVFAQDPDPGVEVEKGDTVTIVVSQGSNAVALPNVVGLQQADAVAQLNGLNMEAVVVEIDTQDQPEGTVLAQDPAPGEEVPEGTRVTLQVVGPAATIAIPDVAGQDQLSAAATLGRNFQVETDQEGSDSVPVGQRDPHRPAGGHDGAPRQRGEDVHLGGLADHDGARSRGLDGVGSLGSPHERGTDHGRPVRQPVER